MNRSLEEALKMLNENKNELARRFKVQKIGVFGSFSRKENIETSDIDILVTFREPVGWEFVDLAQYLEALLDMRVDLVTPDALRPRSREDILREVVYV